MARLDQLLCDRCPRGRQRPAVTTEQYCVEGEWFEIDLCEDHRAAFSRDFYSWTLLSREIDPIKPKSKSTVFTADTIERSKQAAELRAAAAARQPKPEPEPEPAPIEEAPIPDELAARRAQEHRLRRSIPGALKYRLTGHAVDRMTERGFDLEAVLRCAAEPDHSRGSRSDSRCLIQERGRCRVVVDKSTHNIVTVVDRSASDEDTDRDIATAYANATPELERTAL